MAFCPNCGAAVDGRYCAKCGTAVDPASPPSGPVPVIDASGLSANLAAGLCYIPGFIVPIVFLVIEPHSKNKLVRFNAFQSLFLNLVMVVLFYALSFFPFGFWRLSGLVELAFLVLSVFLLLQTYQGKKIVLPVIGDLAAKQA